MKTEDRKTILKMQERILELETEIARMKKNAANLYAPRVGSNPVRRTICGLCSGTGLSYEVHGTSSSKDICWGCQGKGWVKHED